MRLCVKCHISGVVQGVWYRGSTQTQAEQLGVTGYARNLSDGRVEVLACGEREAIESLKQWCWDGPRMAQVTDVQCQVVQPGEEPTSFTTS